MMDGGPDGAVEDDGFQQRLSRCRRTGATSAAQATRTISPTGLPSTAAQDAWQQAKKKGKGRVPVCPPSRTHEPGTSSAAPQLSGVAAATGPVGPLATVPRGRTPERRPDRARSPRRPQATGTPATTGESGSLADPVVALPREEPDDMLSAAARGDEAATSEVASSLSSLKCSREASPAAPDAQTAPVQIPPATGPPLEENPGGSAQPNERGGASALS
jgi:hypothetical protein